jgi:hypothetical protein
MADLLYWMAKLETQICPALDNHLPHIPQSDGFHSWDDHSQHEQDNESTPDQTPPIVQELYARIGEYKVYFEEIHNFESELRRELNEREALRAGGYQVDPDIEFFHERKRLRKQMQQDLDQAQAEVHRLREECRRRGIILDDDAYIPSPSASDQSFTLTPSHERALDKSSTDSLRPSKSSSIITEFFQAQNRVADWLERPPRQDEAVQPAQISPPDDTGEAIDDCISEESWVAPCRPSRLLPQPTPATINKIRNSLPQMPVFAGPTAGSTEIESLLHKAMSESIAPTARRFPSRATI